MYGVGLLEEWQWQWRIHILSHCEVERDQWNTGQFSWRPMNGRTCTVLLITSFCLVFIQYYFFWQHYASVLKWPHVHLLMCVLALTGPWVTCLILFTTHTVNQTLKCIENTFKLFFYKFCCLSKSDIFSRASSWGRCVYLCLFCMADSSNCCTGPMRRTRWRCSGGHIELRARSNWCPCCCSSGRCGRWPPLWRCTPCFLHRPPSGSTSPGWRSCGTERRPRLQRGSRELQKRQLKHDYTTVLFCLLCDFRTCQAPVCKSMVLLGWLSHWLFSAVTLKLYSTPHSRSSTSQLLLEDVEQLPM